MENNFNPEKIKLIIGLGNPGDKYNNTYHNIGKEFTNFLRKNITPPHDKKIVDSKCFMNRSGVCANEEISKFGVNPNQTLIVHDDSDIFLGEYKFSFGKGSAGHKGIISIIDHIKTKEFWRLRIGIRDPEENKKAGSFVLQKIDKEKELIFKKVFKDLVYIIEDKAN